MTKGVTKGATKRWKPPMGKQPQCTPRGCLCAQLARNHEPGFATTARYECPHGNMFVVVVESTLSMLTAAELQRDGRLGRDRNPTPETPDAAFERLFGDTVTLPPGALDNREAVRKANRRAKQQRQRQRPQEPPKFADGVVIQHRGDGNEVIKVPPEQWTRLDIGKHARETIEHMLTAAKRSNTSQYRTLAIRHRQHNAEQRSTIDLMVKLNDNQQPEVRLNGGDVRTAKDGVAGLRQQLLRLAPPLQLQRRTLQ